MTEKKECINNYDGKLTMIIGKEKLMKSFGFVQLNYLEQN
jgi:hypothetical protein